MTSLTMNTSMESPSILYPCKSIYRLLLYYNHAIRVIQTLILHCLKCIIKLTWYQSHTSCHNCSIRWLCTDEAAIKLPLPGPLNDVIKSHISAFSPPLSVLILGGVPISKIACSNRSRSLLFIIDGTMQVHYISRKAINISMSDKFPTY